MSSFMQKAALLASLAASAYAHGRIVSIDVDGTEYEGFTSAMAYSGASDIIAWSAENGDNGFVGPESYGSSDIACHKSGKPGSKVATVAAGGKIKLQWDTWPESHHGPVLDYLAKCAGDDCTSASAGDLSFFKIDQKGLNDAAAQNWASDDLIKNDFAWTVTVPEDIAPGQYVLRHEIIALHSAQDTNGAQNYPQCINIEVTGSGTAEPAGVVATELYTASDPGISLSIYNGLTDYEIPGPAVYSGGASGSAPSTGGSSSGSSSSKPASSAPAATSAAASSAPYATSNSTTQASAPSSTEAATTSESAPEPTGEPTFAGSAPASSTSCTTTITLTGSSPATASATQSSTPIETSDNSEDDSEDDSEEEESSGNSSSGSSSSGSSNNTPTTTTAPAASISAVASSLPSSVLDAPIPTSTSSSDKADGKPSKALPEGFTLKDLLEWVNYLLSKAYNAEGKHARDVTRR